MVQILPNLLKRVEVNLKDHDTAYDTSDKKWFTDSESEWKYVTPQGGVYHGNGTLWGGVDASRFEEPALMKRVNVSLAQHESAYDTVDKKWRGQNG